MKTRTTWTWALTVIASMAVGGRAFALPEALPVVLRGASIPWEQAMPGDLVAFAHLNDWVQIPVQVDERDRREFSAIYGDGAARNPNTASFGRGFFDEFYCDPATFTGPDSDPTIDANDEIVFMAGDAGPRAASDILPDGVRPGSGLEIEIRDPRTAETAYVYLFLRSEEGDPLDPSAGSRYVEYRFETLAGEYKKTYNTAGSDRATGLRNSDHGPQLNPEDSTIRTPVYERHWSYRWTCDTLELFGGESLVEREDYWIRPGACGRHLGTFNAQEGCFVANLSGPVRAIRSYLGANSGPLVQVDRIYYGAREENTLYLRVHPRSSVGMFYTDHTEAALDMTYFNDLNLRGVLIDGLPDRLVTGRVRWELVAGDAGSIVRLHDLDTDISFADEEFTLFYADDLNTETLLCQACTSGCPEPESLGDAHLIGASGSWITAQLPNTDPRLPDPHFMSIRVISHYGAPHRDVAWAESLRASQDAPLDATVHEWNGGPGAGG